MTGDSSASPDVAAERPPLAVVRDRALLRLTLDRPEAWNALTRDMKRAFSEALKRWGTGPDIYAIALDSAFPRAFCSGADLAEFTDPAARLDEILAVQAEETRLLWQFECCVKPIVSLIDGVVMGSGAGISMFGTHRVAGEGYSFAMPETGIGYFPDAGATFFLGGLPDSIGVYLGLTGARVSRADAYPLGLVTHCIDRTHYDGIRAALADADPVDPLLDERHISPEPGPVARLRPAIARCFSRDTVEEIMAALDAERGSDAEWARSTQATLSKRSPASLKITLRQLRSPARLDLKQALELEYRMAVRCLARGDFQEGIRSVIRKGSAAPVWSPLTLETVRDGDVDAIFAPLGDRELSLPPRPSSISALA